jgi:glycosyltransferase involved in cell wall biosynthesis
VDIVYLLAASYARGGVKVCIEHCNRLAARGHHVSVISRDRKPDWIEVRVPWETVEGRLGETLPGCDVAVFSFYEQAFFLLEAALELGVLPVYFAQGDELIFGEPETAEEGEIRSARHAARASLRLPYPLVTVSSSAAEKIRSLGGEKVHVVPNGIDRGIFRPAKRDNAVPRILSVGSEASRFKGVPEICGALIKLHREGIGFTFARASPIPDLIGDLPFPVEFHHNPSQLHLAELYSQSDIFVGASHSESFYLPPLEAMACGTAVVCSDLPEVREYAEPGEDFLPFPPGDVPAMTGQIRRVLRYPELRRRLAQRGLQAAEMMDWDRVIPKFERLLFELLDGREEIFEAMRREVDRPTVPWREAPL